MIAKQDKTNEAIDYEVVGSIFVHKGNKIGCDSEREIEASCTR